MTTDKVLRDIKILREKPFMLLSGSTIDYPRLQLFIEGYIHGLGSAFETNLILNMTHWFQKKVNQKASVFFTNHIPHFYRNRSDEELRVILLQTIEDFFKENSDWSKKYNP